MRMPVCAVLKLCRLVADVVRESIRIVSCMVHWIRIGSEASLLLLSCIALCLDVMPLDLKEAARPGGRAWRSRRRAVVHHHRRALWLAAGPVHVVADAADHEEGGATTASGSADDGAHACARSRHFFGHLQRWRGRRWSRWRRWRRPWGRRRRREEAWCVRDGDDARRVRGRGEEGARRRR